LGRLTIRKLLLRLGIGRAARLRARRDALELGRCAQGLGQHWP
jgi:hypothetical protein